MQVKELTSENPLINTYTSVHLTNRRNEKRFEHERQMKLSNRHNGQCKIWMMINTD